MSPTLQVLSILLSAFASVVGTLVLYNLRQLSRRLDIHDKRMDNLEDEQKQLAARKEVCQQEFISSGQFIREAGYTRQRLDQALEEVKGLSAKMDIITQMPKIAGEVASKTVQEMMKYQKKGTSNGTES